ncbi:MAG: hypothetical protein H7Y06_09100 [Opitutaceae bacterium]|nr:hypothetical protein [Opitutaceae bacterium]
MKLNTAVAKSLLMAASIGMIVPLAAQTTPKPKTTKPAPAPTEEPAKIEGLEITRANGTFLGLTVEGPRLVLKFYDKDKKPAPIDIARAAARWEPLNKPGDERSMMNPNEANTALTSTPVVKPPLVFKVYITLLDAEGKAVESIIADLRQLNHPAAK